MLFLGWSVFIPCQWPVFGNVISRFWSDEELFFGTGSLVSSGVTHSSLFQGAVLGSPLAVVCTFTLRSIFRTWVLQKLAAQCPAAIDSSLPSTAWRLMCCGSTANAKVCILYSSATKMCESGAHEKTEIVLFFLTFFLRCLDYEVRAHGFWLLEWVTSFAPSSYHFVTSYSSLDFEVLPLRVFILSFDWFFPNIHHLKP